MSDLGYQYIFGDEAALVAAAGTTSAAITGTATVGITEEDIVAGGKTIIITLTNDTWVADDGTFAGIRQDIIDGLDSDGVEATGWNAEVRDKQGVGGVVRTSDTVATITLDAQAAYNISAPEEITVTVPASALITSAVEVVGSPLFTVTQVDHSVARLQPEPMTLRRSKVRNHARRRLATQISTAYPFFAVAKFDDHQTFLTPDVRKRPRKTRTRVAVQHSRSYSIPRDRSIAVDPIVLKFLSPVPGALDDSLPDDPTPPGVSIRRPGGHVAGTDIVRGNVRHGQKVRPA